MSFTPVKPLGTWAGSDVPGTNWYNTIDQNVSRAIDGYAGGTYTPSAAIVLSGSGLEIRGATGMAVTNSGKVTFFSGTELEMNTSTLDLNSVTADMDASSTLAFHGTSITLAGAIVSGSGGTDITLTDNNLVTLNGSSRIDVSAAGASIKVNAASGGINFMNGQYPKLDSGHAGRTKERLTNLNAYYLSTGTVTRTNAGGITLGNGASISMLLDLHHGATLSAVTVCYRALGTRSAITSYPKLGIVRCTRSNALASAGVGLFSGGDLFDDMHPLEYTGFANYGQLEAGLEMRFEPDQNHTVLDASDDRLALVLYADSSTGGSGISVGGLLLEWTAIADMRFA